MFDKIWRLYDTDNIGQKYDHCITPIICDRHTTTVQLPSYLTKYDNFATSSCMYEFTELLALAERPGEHLFRAHGFPIVQTGAPAGWRRRWGVSLILYFRGCFVIKLACGYIGRMSLESSRVISTYVFKLCGVIRRSLGVFYMLWRPGGREGTVFSVLFSGGTTRGGNH